MYALIEFAGKQFEVEDGRSIKVPRLDGKIGSKITIDKVLYLEYNSKKTIGTPFIKGKKINCEVLSHGREKKIVVFKFKRRKGHQKKNTHRQDYTIIKIGKLGAAKKTSKSNTTNKATSKKSITKKNVKKVPTKKSITAKKEKE